MQPEAVYDLLWLWPQLNKIFYIKRFPEGFPHSTGKINNNGNLTSRFVVG